jgi:hypothetical protein
MDEHNITQTTKKVQVLLSKIPDSTKMMLHYEKQNTVKLIISSG